MKTFGHDDIIFARATRMGREIANIRISGYTSMGAIMRHIKEVSGCGLGLINLTVRNLTQGWSQTGAYMVA